MIRVPVSELQRRFLSYHARLVRYSVGIIGDQVPALREEIANDAAIDAIIELGEISDETLAFRFLANRAKWRTLQRLRKKSVKLVPESLVEEPVDSKGNQMHYDSGLDDVSERWLDNLSAQDRSIVEAWLESPSHGSMKKIAESLRIPVNVVYRVVQKFREDYQGQFGEQER